MFMSESKYLTLELLLGIVPLELMNIARMVCRGLVWLLFRLHYFISQSDIFQKK